MSETFELKVLKEVDPQEIGDAGIYAVPDDVKIIAPGCFAGLKNLKKVILPKGLLAIGNSAFAESGLQSIKIPDSVKMIGKAAFYNCHNLLEVKFPKKMSNQNLGFTFFHEGLVIQDKAFASSGICELTIPDGTTNLGDEIVASCLNLSSITIIGKNEFGFSGMNLVLSKRTFDNSSLTSLKYAIVDENKFGVNEDYFKKNNPELFAKEDLKVETKTYPNFEAIPEASLRLGEGKN